MKTLLLTGATDGIGFETAKMLIQAGHRVVLHGRSLEKLQGVREILVAMHKDALVELVHADLSRMADVHAMAYNLLQKKLPLDGVINNAGIFVLPAGQEQSPDGLDVRFAVNTIAPYILTKKLLPLLSPQSRVINVASAAQAPVNMLALQKYVPLSSDEAYAQSKLALIMWTMAMAELYAQGPHFVAVNPKSFLGSKMVREAYGKEGYDVKIGAEILFKAALSEEFAHASGKYYDNDYATFSSPHPFSLRPEHRAELLQVLDGFMAAV